LAKRHIVATVLDKVSQTEAMDLRFFWMLGFWLAATATVTAQTGKKGTAVRSITGKAKKPAITEAEAKRLHEAQLAREGKTGVRRAYKRSQFVLPPPTETATLAKAPSPMVTAAPAPTMAAPMPAAPAAAKPTQKTPRFIEGMVLERKLG
jgi:hypothetical protein